MPNLKINLLNMNTLIDKSKIAFKKNEQKDNPFRR